MSRRRIGVVLVTAVALVVVWPILRDVYGELGDTLHLSPWWLAAILATVGVQLAANWELHRIVLRTDRWLDVAAPQLVGNAASHVLPGGNAIGAGIQVRMMTVAGFSLTQTVTALAAVTVVGALAGFVILPFVVLAASAAGTSVDSSLVVAMWVGAALLFGVLVLLLVVLSRNGPWRRVAGAVSWVQAKFKRHADAVELERRLLDDRDNIRHALRDRTGRVLLAGLTRSVFDYLALYFSLRAAGAHVNPAAALAAFVVANIAGMIPLTPGGLGFVEVGLSSVLTVAGATDMQANLAVATYRLMETWLPCIAAGVALQWFHRRHRERRLTELLATQPAS